MYVTQNIAKIVFQTGILSPYYIKLKTYEKIFLIGYSRLNNYYFGKSTKIWTFHT